MDNKFYFHHLPQNVAGTTKLIKIVNASVISISTNNGNECIFTLDQNGYRPYGDMISDLRFYYDSTNHFYYVCLKPSYTTAYYNINILSFTNLGYAIMDFDNNFDVSELTELTNQNVELSFNYEKSSSSVTGGTTTEYTSILTRKQYTIQCSLVMFSVRNNNGTGGSALLLLTRTNDASINDFTIQSIYSASLLSQFNITATNKGFSFSNATNYKYSITEIPNIVM